MRDLLAARAGVDEIDQRRAGERLRRHGIGEEDLIARLPQRNGASADDFDELVAHGRVRIDKARR